MVLLAKLVPGADEATEKDEAPEPDILGRKSSLEKPLSSNNFVEVRDVAGKGKGMFATRFYITHLS